MTFAMTDGGECCTRISGVCFVAFPAALDVLPAFFFNAVASHFSFAFQRLMFYVMFQLISYIIDILTTNTNKIV